MLRFFLDSSVFFSAAYSTKGYAREIILAALTNQVRLVISDLVVEETRRNLKHYSEHSVRPFEAIL
jgi:predicted nucleic acid-binding protein